MNKQHNMVLTPCTHIQTQLYLHFIIIGPKTNPLSYYTLQMEQTLEALDDIIKFDGLFYAFAVIVVFIYNRLNESVCGYLCTEFCFFPFFFYLSFCHHLILSVVCSTLSSTVDDIVFGFSASKHNISIQCLIAQFQCCRISFNTENKRKIP